MNVVSGIGVLGLSVTSVNGRTASAQKGSTNTWDDDVSDDNDDGHEDTEWNPNQCYI